MVKSGLLDVGDRSSILFVDCSLISFYNNESSSTTLVALFATSMMSLVPLSADTWVFKWMPLFCLGIITSKTKPSDYLRPGYLTSVVAIVGLSTSAVGIVHTTAGGLTIVAILLFQDRKLPAVFLPIAGLGGLSYSLYLLHVPIGGRLINIATRLDEYSIYRELSVLLAVCSSLTLAWIYWKIVELPSQKWARFSPQFASIKSGSDSSK